MPQNFQSISDVRNKLNLNEPGQYKRTVDGFFDTCLKCGEKNLFMAVKLYGYGKGTLMECPRADKICEYKEDDGKFGKLSRGKPFCMLFEAFGESIVRDARLHTNGQSNDFD